MPGSDRGTGQSIGYTIAWGKLRVKGSHGPARGNRLGGAGEREERCVRVLVAGAHGKTARRLVRTLIGNGHEVRGLVRKEEQLADVEADGAEPVLVDLENEEVDGRVGEAVAGCDAVVFAAGAGPGSGEARKETMDYGGGAENAEGAAKEGAHPHPLFSPLGAGDPE